jgi:hypothetical protein
MQARPLRTLSAGSLLLATALSAPAQALSPAPAAGAWQTDSKFTINGQDLGALMRQAMQDALKQMPAAERKAAEEMMKGQLAAWGGPEQECVTAEEAARRTTARAVLDDLQQDAPHCRYEAVQVTGGTLRFKGRCADPEGFTGDVAGEMSMSGPKAWTARWTGSGTMAQVEEIPGLKVGADGRVQMVWTGSGRWLAASCPPR